MHSPYLPTSPYIPLHPPTSPYISPSLLLPIAHELLGDALERVRDGRLARALEGEAAVDRQAAETAAELVATWLGVGVGVGLVLGLGFGLGLGLGSG